MESKAEQYDVVISGMGPGGLAAAYQALKSGKSTLIISDRPPGFVRVQNVFIKCAQRNYLREMHPCDPWLEKVTDLEDNKFFNALDGDLGIGIKDIERYLMRRLNEFKANIRFDVLYQSKLTHIDMSNGGLTVAQTVNDGTLFHSEKEKTFGFTYLIGADGIGRHALTILERDEKLQTKSDLMEISKKVHKYHVSAYLSVQRKDGKKINLPDKFGLSAVYNNLLAVIRLQREQYDKQPEDTNGFKPLKITFLSELPKDIYESKFIHDESLFNYVQEAVSSIFKQFELDNDELHIELVKLSRKHGESKDKLKMLAFEYRPLELHRAVYHTHNRYFLQLGDSLINHHYVFGSGLMMALETSKLIGFLLKGRISIYDYFKKCFTLFVQLEHSCSDKILKYEACKADFADDLEQRVAEEQRVIASSLGREECVIS